MNMRLMFYLNFITVNMKSLLGPYAGLMSREERKPLLIGQMKKEVTSNPQRLVIGQPAQRNVSLLPQDIFKLE